MQQIHEQLWITDISGVQTNSTDPFDRVITVCQDGVIDNVGCAYEYYNMSDGPDNAYGGDCSYSLFEQAAGSLLRALDSGEVVLIHCHMGQSRSASVAVAAIGVHESMDFDEAFMFVKEQRPVVNPETRLRRFSRRFIEEHGSS